MRNFVRLIICGSLILVVTGATNLVYLIPSAGVGIGGVLALLAVVAAFALAFIFLKQGGDPVLTRYAGIEILLATAILYLPVFTAIFWIHYSPQSLSSFGVVQIMIAITTLLIFQLTLYLNESELRYSLQIALAIYVGSIVYSFFANGVILALSGERPGGFLINPNDGADVTVALLLLSLPWNRRSISGYALIVIALVGVALTLSRSGLFLWFVVSASFAWTALTRGRSYAKLLTVAMVVLAIGAAGIFITESAELAQELSLGPGTLGVGSGTLDRIKSIASLMQGDTSTLNNTGRGTLLEAWTRKATQTPFLGKGTNFSLSDMGPSLGNKHEGPHNTYVARLVDSGFLGLATLLAFILFWMCFFLARRHNTGFFYLALYAIACLFSHNMADSRPMVALFGILAAEATRAASQPRKHSSGMDRHKLLGAAGRQG